MNATTREPPTGHRDDQGRLHGLDWNDPDTMAWIHAKQAEHQTNTENRAKRTHSRNRQLKRRASRASRRANRG